MYIFVLLTIYNSFRISFVKSDERRKVSNLRKMSICLTSILLKFLLVCISFLDDECHQVKSSLLPVTHGRPYELMFKASS